jgi:hypothetical protein
MWRAIECTLLDLLCKFLGDEIKTAPIAGRRLNWVGVSGSIGRLIGLVFR